MLHLSHPREGYTRNDYRLQDAAERDERDLNRLNACADLVGRTLDALIPYIKQGPLEHPDARWRPDDLSMALEEQAANIRHEQRKIARCPLVLDSRDDDELP